MAKEYTPKTEPASLNESTLEANIACEITNLFNSPNFYYDSNPKLCRLFFEFHYFSESKNWQSTHKKKCKILRLSPIEENKGGGWDSKFDIPTSKSDMRAIFIQFKKGKGMHGNNIINSKFNYCIKNPNPHIEFEFNNNKGNNQHQTLKKLSESEKLIEKAVLYAFPRIIEMQAFSDLNEDLLLHTTFLTLEEMDTEAKKLLSEPYLYDGKNHSFRTCYNDENEMEISSEPFPITNHSFSKGFLYELLLIKMNRMRNNFEDLKIANFFILYQLAFYLRILPKNNLFEQDFFGRNLRQYLEDNLSEYLTLRNESNGLLSTSSIEWRLQLFNNIFSFFDSAEEKINESTIPSEFTFSLPTEYPIEIMFNSEEPTDFEFSLFTF